MSVWSMVYGLCLYLHLYLLVYLNLSIPISSISISTSIYLYFYLYLYREFRESLDVLEAVEKNLILTGSLPLRGIVYSQEIRRAFHWLMISPVRGKES